MSSRSVKFDHVASVATDFLEWGHPRSNQQSQTIRIVGFHDKLASLIKQTPTHTLLIDSSGSASKPFFHSGIAVLGSDLYITSSPLAATDSSQIPHILISRVKLTSTPSEKASSNDVVTTVEWWKMRSPPGIAMPAGVTSSKDMAVFSAQGNFESDSGGVFVLHKGVKVEPLITNFFGRQFNSPHSLVLDHDAVWFTDPDCGFEQDFRNAPTLPPQVYMVRPATKEVRAMADGFARPTGLSFDSRGLTLYVCDSGAASTSANNISRSATVYAFDYDRDRDHLTNRRLFAFVRHGVPTDVKCDSSDNVYVACGDGVEIYDRKGALLGVIEVPGGVPSFCFGKKSELFLCNSDRLWCINLL